MSTEPGVQTTGDYLDSGIKILSEWIAQLNALRDAGPEIHELLTHVQRVWKDDHGWIWLLRYNAVLEAAPIDLLSRGEVAPVRDLLGRIEHGIAV